MLPPATSSTAPATSPTGTLAVGITPAASTGTTSVGVSPAMQTVAALVPTPQAYGVFIPDHKAKPDSGKVGLFATSRGAVVPIDPKKVKGLKKTNIMQRCRKVWADAKEFIKQREGGGASEVVIDAKPNPDAPERDYIIISYRDKTGQLKRIQHNEVPLEIQKRMEKIRRLVRSDRSPVAPTPLQLPAGEILPKSCNEFLKTHYRELEATLKENEPAKKEAVRNIVTAEATIQGLSIHLRIQISHKEQELEKIPLLPYPVHKKAKEDLDELKKLYQEIQSIDRYAVYWAVATWANLKTGELDDATRTAIRQKADQLSISVKKDIGDKEKQRQSNHWFKNNIFRKIRLSSFKPMDSPDMHKYALDTGNLLLQDHQAIGKRQEDSEEAPTKACVEQLIVQMMMNLQNDAQTINPDTNPTLQTLSEENRHLVSQLIGFTQRNDDQYFPKAYARDVYKEIGQLSADQAIGLKDRKNPHLRLDKLLSPAASA